jgi:predicted RNase H-like nuclease (RuvC/YqgF family)
MEHQNKYDEERRQMEARIQELSKKTNNYEMERESLASKFQQSLKML